MLNASTTPAWPSCLTGGRARTGCAAGVPTLCPPTMRSALGTARYCRRHTCPRLRVPPTSSVLARPRPVTAHYMAITGLIPPVAGVAPDVPHPPVGPGPEPRDGLRSCSPDIAGTSTGAIAPFRHRRWPPARGRATGRHERSVAVVAAAAPIMTVVTAVAVPPVPPVVVVVAVVSNGGRGVDHRVQLLSVLRKDARPVAGTTVVAAAVRSAIATRCPVVGR